MFEFISIGQVLKPFRTQGDLLATIHPEAFEDLEKCKAVFLRIDGIEVPFFIEELTLDEETCVLKLEDFNSPEQIKPFNGSYIYLRSTDLSQPEKFEKSVDTMDLTGFVIHDKNSDLSFSILGVEEYPQQLMARVALDEKEFLIPLIEDWIVKIDPEQAMIHMTLPEGILEI